MCRDGARVLSSSLAFVVVGSRTAPCMHDGSFATLEDVVEYYDRGAVQNPALDHRIRPLQLTLGDKRDLSAFLRSLSEAFAIANSVERDVASTMVVRETALPAVHE
jgi:cytochrome c peroxidase